MDNQVASKKMNDMAKPMSVASTLIGLALFIIAYIAWSKTKQLPTLSEKGCVDPEAKLNLNKEIKSIHDMTFLLWLVPLLLSLVTFVVYYASKKGDKTEKAAFNEYKPLVDTYRCEVPRYNRPY
jgi:hypothetical protein